MAFESGRVYVAPRDHHLVVEDGVVRTDRGPKQHRTRPAIDPLFRSAAREYGPRVIGVLLSGFGADGVDGLIAIKAAGGLSIVQDPLDARHGWMPRNAIAGDDVDYVLLLASIPDALVTLVAGGAVAKTDHTTAR
jgi:two-component system chemotaxis response regulator CheB